MTILSEQQEVEFRRIVNTTAAKDVDLRFHERKDFLDTISDLRTRLKEAEEKLALLEPQANNLSAEREALEGLLELLPCGHRRVEWVEPAMAGTEPDTLVLAHCGQCARDSAREKGLRKHLRWALGFCPGIQPLFFSSGYQAQGGWKCCGCRVSLGANNQVIHQTDCPYAAALTASCDAITGPFSDPSNALATTDAPTKETR